MPVGIIAGLVDFWGVVWGPVGSWSVSAPAAVSQMASAASASVAVPHYVTLPKDLAVFANISPPSFIGIGDFVFLALFLTCAYRLGFSPKRTMWGIFCGLLCSSLVLAMSGLTICGIKVQIDYLPGLAFISAGVLLANLGYWKLSRQEWGMTLGLVAVFVALIGYSAYANEQSKPHIRQQQMTITASSGRAAIEQVAMRLREKLKPGTELLPIAIEAAFFARPPHTPAVITQWKIILVERRAKASLHDLHDFVIDGVNQGPLAATTDKKVSRWLVIVNSQSPPKTSLQILASLNRKRADDLTLLNGTSGIPASAFSLFDMQGPYFKQQKLPALFGLGMCPGYGELLSRKSIVKLPYNAQSVRGRGRI